MKSDRRTTEMLRNASAILLLRKSVGIALAAYCQAIIQTTKPGEVGDPVLIYARSKGLLIREEDLAFHLEIPKEDLLIEVTVLKDNDVLKWFVSAYDADSGYESFSPYVPHSAVEDEVHEELVVDLDAGALATLKALHQNEVRITKSEPLFRLFGRAFFGGPELQHRSEQGWKAWDDANL